MRQITQTTAVVLRWTVILLGVVVLGPGFELREPHDP